MTKICDSILYMNQHVFMDYFLKCFLVILNGAELERRIDELLSAVGDSS